MHTLDFVRKYVGQYVTAPGGVGRQCVDLINVYLIERWNQQPVRLNAVDWQRATIPGYRWVRNTPDGYPAIGALVVWNPMSALGIGQYGHIAIALVADTSKLVTFDQDWPFGDPCRLTIHTYQGVAGWHELQGQ